MGQITSLFAWKFIRQTRPGVERAPLLREAGIDPEAPVDPKAMIPAENYYRLLERLDVEDGAVDLPLRTGGSMRCDDYGAFGLAFKSAVDLRGSYARTERYARVLTSVSTYEVVVSGETAAMRHHREGKRRGLRMSNEATMASVLTISREVSTQPVQPRRATLRHGAPARTDLHEAFFGCPVDFEAPYDALIFARADLEVPNKLGTRPSRASSTRTSKASSRRSRTTRASSSACASRSPRPSARASRRSATRPSASA